MGRQIVTLWSGSFVPNNNVQDDLGDTRCGCAIVREYGLKVNCVVWRCVIWQPCIMTCFWDRKRLCQLCNFMTSSWSIIGWTFSGLEIVGRTLLSFCTIKGHQLVTGGGTAKSLSRSADCWFWFCLQKVAMCLDCTPVKRTYLSVVYDLEDSGSCINVHILIIKRFNCVFLNMADSEIQHLPLCTSLNRLHSLQHPVCHYIVFPLTSHRQ